MNYDKVDPDEIIEKLKDIVRKIQELKNKIHNEEKLSITS